MAIIREHLAAQGARAALRPAERALDRRATTSVCCSCSSTAPTSRRRSSSTACSTGTTGFAFGITEPEHGSDATHMETQRRARRRRLADQRREDLEHGHPHGALRPHLRAHERQGGRRRRHHRLPRPDRQRRASRSRSTSGPSTCRPTTPASRSRTCGCRTRRSSAARAAASQVVQHFFNENRIRQAASSLGAAQYCIDAVGRVRQGAQAVRQAAARRTRRSSFRWSSCRRSARCCGR